MPQAPFIFFSSELEYGSKLNPGSDFIKNVPPVLEIIKTAF
jgi:hypothetical protein